MDDSPFQGRDLSQLSRSCQLFCASSRFSMCWPAAEHPDAPPEFNTEFQGKIVLIGETYQFSPDQKATPFDDQSITRMMWGRAQSFTPGVEIHAHTIQTILDRRFITTPLLLSTPILLFVWVASWGWF